MACESGTTAGPEELRLGREMEKGPERRTSAEPGLCATCRNSRQVAGANSVFLLCELALSDPRFSRYPRLPVVSCPGFVSRVEEDRDPPRPAP